ncbi:alpha/beta hydrolase [Enterovirga rhinocerotis]|uniref:alpha/beta hydrolase n=1 Tax=Enterovirga rhinocerotis TaxID=1339210 RepID=UPI001414E95E|nr:alpha/beta hydrolase [Enterovirga rhinocerotis]
MKRTPHRIVLLAALALLAPTLAEARMDQARAIACPGAGRSWLVPFASAPFPYDGDVPGKGPFLDKRDGERRGHASPRGGVYWENPTYSDNRVLISVPKGFDPARPAVIVVYLHGNLATLEREVCRSQGVPRQVAASGLNAILLAPQLAVNALDSSAGRFWEAGGLRRFLDEAGAVLPALVGSGSHASLPVIVAAYSGGYLPAAFGLSVGGATDRIVGLLLLDALYGEVDRFAEIVAARRGRMAFVSAYSASSRVENARLRSLLAARGLDSGEGVPPKLGPGTVSFVPTPPATEHGTFLTRAFAPDPLKVLLGRFETYRIGRR